MSDMTQFYNMSWHFLIVLWKCKDKNENARTKRKMQGRHKKLFFGSLRASRAFKKRKFSAISNIVLSIMEKFFCHAQHLVMSPYLILARPSGNLKKWTVSNLTFPWWTFAPINRIAYLRTISSAINSKAWDFSYMPFQQCAMINIA